jgi:hypothetical protein
VAGIGMLMLLRVNASADYAADVLPGVVVFGLGLSATVAPLTATVLDSVEERHVGLASGINNAVSRIAGLMAIAVLGAVIAASFNSTLDSKLSGVQLGPKAQHAVKEARAAALAGSNTKGVPAQDRRVVDPAVADASTDGFHLAVLLCGFLLLAGGGISGVGIRNPEKAGPQRPESVPRAATAGDCGHCPEGGDGLPQLEPADQPAEIPA